MSVTFPLSESGIDEKTLLPWVNKELIPLLRQLRAAANAAVTTTLTVEVLTDAATVTPAGAATGDYLGTLAAVSQATAFANPTTDLENGRVLRIRAKSAASQTASFGSKYRGGVSLALPLATSGGGLTDYWGFIRHEADDTYDYVGEALGY